MNTAGQQVALCKCKKVKGFPSRAAVLMDELGGIILKPLFIYIYIFNNIY